MRRKLLSTKELCNHCLLISKFLLRDHVWSGHARTSLESKIVRIIDLKKYVDTKTRHIKRQDSAVNTSVATDAHEMCQKIEKAFV